MRTVAIENSNIADPVNRLEGAGGNPIGAGGSIPIALLGAAVIEKAIEVIETNEPILNENKTIDEVAAEAKPGRETKGKTKQLEKDGGIEQAIQDFDTLGVSDIKNYENGTRAGKLQDGSKVNIRPKSKSGQPTLEVIKPNGIRIKIRY